MKKGSERKIWEERFLALIPVGRCRAVSMNQLADMAGIDPRIVRSTILTLRKEGQIIASCPSGYFIPATIEEELSFYLAHRKRAMSNLVSLKATRKHLREMGIDLRGR